MNLIKTTIFMTVALLYVFNAHAAAAGDEVVPSAPIVIKNIEDWRAMVSTWTEGGHAKRYRLETDLILKVPALDAIPRDKPFTGRLDGNDHLLSFDRSEAGPNSFPGLFGDVDNPDPSDLTIKNLALYFGEGYRLDGPLIGILAERSVNGYICGVTIGIPGEYFFATPRTVYAIAPTMCAQVSFVNISVTSQARNVVSAELSTLTQERPTETPVKEYDGPGDALKHPALKALSHVQMTTAEISGDIKDVASHQLDIIPDNPMGYRHGPVITAGGKSEEPKTVWYDTFIPPNGGYRFYHVEPQKPAVATGS